MENEVLGGWLMRDRALKVLVLLAYLFMLLMNFLANWLPINQLNTGQVSDLYPNLFAPAGFTFSIWAIIYILLGVYVFHAITGHHTKDFEAHVAIFFIVSSIANGAWIIAWHFLWIGVSLGLMGLIFVSLIMVVRKIELSNYSHHLSKHEHHVVTVPFYVYLAWITVAMIANTTTFLVAIQWHRFGLSEVFYVVVVLIVGLLISYFMIKKYHSVSYGLVIIWAYFGILIKHIAPSGFNLQYPIVVVTIIMSLLFLIKVTLKAR